MRHTAMSVSVLTATRLPGYHNARNLIFSSYKQYSVQLQVTELQAVY